MPGHLNQQLQQFSGFLNPLQASFAPLFSGSTPAPNVVPPFGHPQEIPQVSPGTSPSPTQVDPTRIFPHSGTQPQVSSNSSVDLSEADTSED